MSTQSSALFSALCRDAIGYDPLSRFEYQVQTPKYPPHNIVKLNDTQYQLCLAVAGFSKDELTITAEDRLITIVGTAKEEEKPEGYEELYRGISRRDFNRSWQLGDYVEVTNVKLLDGMLTVTLERKVPEAMKARTVKID